MKTNRLVIVDGVRTPFCKAGTDLAPLAADELGRIVVNALVTRLGLDPALVDEVIFGCVAQPADAANVTRVIALRAGIPESVPALTVQRNCASGCEAITLAQEKLQAGRSSVFIVGGQRRQVRACLAERRADTVHDHELIRLHSVGTPLPVEVVAGSRSPAPAMSQALAGLVVTASACGR